MSELLGTSAAVNGFIATHLGTNKHISTAFAELLARLADEHALAITTAIGDLQRENEALSRRVSELSRVAQVDQDQLQAPSARTECHEEEAGSGAEQDTDGVSRLAEKVLRREMRNELSFINPCTPVPLSSCQRNGRVPRLNTWSPSNDKPDRSDFDVAEVDTEPSKNDASGRHPVKSSSFSGMDSVIREKHLPGQAVLLNGRNLGLAAKSPPRAESWSIFEGQQPSLCVAQPGHAGQMALPHPNERTSILLASTNTLQTSISAHDPRSSSPRASVCGSDMHVRRTSTRAPVRRVTWSPNSIASNSEMVMVPERQASICRGGSDSDEENDEGIVLHAVWQGRGRVMFGATGHSPRPSRSESFLKRTLRHAGTAHTMQEDAGSSSFAERFLSKLAIRPGSTKHLVWDLLGIVLIGYDVVVIPLQAFEPQANQLTDAIAWCATVFWTFNIPISFLFGFHSKGIIEMRLQKIARHYMRTWLVFDVMSVQVDWAVSITELIGAEIAGERSTAYIRVLRVLRVLQLLRLLRILKVQSAMSDIAERVRSEFCLVMLGILKLIVLIMLASHLIACAWYGVGILGRSNRRTWVKAYFQGETLWYRYATSLHWSITQFTPASMEVVPQNGGERAFAVCVLLFAMVTFSSFISSITNAMTQLRNLNSERHEQLSVLRRYLLENRISGPTMVRIWGCLQEAMDMSKHRLHEQDVSILQLLPWSLKSDLQEEIFAPVLGSHPLFLQYGQTYPHQMQRIYQRALDEVSLGIGKQLFHCGEESADRMYFVRSGMLSFSQDDLQPTVLATGQWVCEPVLWIKWKHTGDLVATTHCELVALRASKLHDIMQSCKEPVKYARHFAMYFRQYSNILSDIYVDHEVLQNMVQKAFSEDECPRSGTDVCLKESLSAVPEQHDVTRCRSFGHILFGHPASTMHSSLTLPRAKSLEDPGTRRQSFLFSSGGVFGRRMSWMRGSASTDNIDASQTGGDELSGEDTSDSGGSDSDETQSVVSGSDDSGAKTPGNAHGAMSGNNSSSTLPRSRPVAALPPQQLPLGIPPLLVEDGENTAANSDHPFTAPDTCRDMGKVASCNIETEVDLPTLLSHRSTNTRVSHDANPTHSAKGENRRNVSQPPLAWH